VRDDRRQRVAPLADVQPASDHAAFVEEFFGPMYVTTSLLGDTTVHYLDRHVD